MFSLRNRKTHSRKTFNPLDKPWILSKWSSSSMQKFEETRHITVSIIWYFSYTRTSYAFFAWSLKINLVKLEYNIVYVLQEQSKLIWKYKIIKLMHCLFKALPSNEKKKKNKSENESFLFPDLCKLILDSLNSSKQTSCTLMDFNNIKNQSIFSSQNNHLELNRPEFKEHFLISNSNNDNHS